MWKHSTSEKDRERESEADLLLNEVLLNQDVVTYS